MLLKDIDQPPKQEFLSCLAKLGIATIQDVLFYFPRTYEDRRNIAEMKDIHSETPCCVYGEVKSSHWQTTKTTNKKLFEAVIEDENGDKIALQWFFATNRLAGFIKKQPHIMAFGTPKFRHFMPVMMNPDWSPYATLDNPGLHFGRIVPVYGLTEGIRQEQMRDFLYKIVTFYLYDHAQPYIPDHLAQRYHLPDFYEAMKEVHFPVCADMNRLVDKNTPAHKRLIYEELLVKSLCIEIGRRSMVGERIVVKANNIEYADIIHAMYTNAGYYPTPTQVQVIKECISDIVTGLPIRKILNGDVGTGKTTVAFDVASYIKACGMQTAIMVPTEILARQHFSVAQKLFKDTSVTCDLLIGGMKNGERQAACDALMNGDTNIVIGTHALLQDDIEFKKLGLIIIDEQHKFGAIQRTVLAQKGKNIHLIQMSATPIPRTILMTLYGDMSVSTLQRIPGKVPALTKVFSESQRKKLYAFMTSFLETGDQIYIVYPLVEDSDKVDLLSATTMAEKLQTEFSRYTVGLVHGQMPSKDKDAVMEQFKKGEIHILVSTTVIEVGIDVHNATIMIVEHAERFGLSQLHQLRGRVGRGKKESYCILVTHGRLNDDAKKRIEAMLKTTDGFEIADIDLGIRGPGDYFGSEQSGFISNFQMADIVRDVKALEYARKDARELLDDDVDLTQYPLLKEKVNSIIGNVYV